MNDVQACRIYCKVAQRAGDFWEVYPDSRSECEWKEIAQEIRAIIAAPSTAAAAKVIEWWYSGDSRRKARSFARAVRDLAGQPALKKE